MSFVCRILLISHCIFLPIRPSFTVEQALKEDKSLVAYCQSRLVTTMEIEMREVEQRAAIINTPL